MFSGNFSAKIGRNFLQRTTGWNKRKRNLKERIAKSAFGLPISQTIKRFTETFLKSKKMKQRSFGTTTITTV